MLERDIGLISLNDPIDTTTPQGRLVFNIFAALAEFERDLIRERTQAGLKAARARGRTGGRPPGLSKEAKATAMAAETLYKEGELPILEHTTDTSGYTEAVGKPPAQQRRIGPRSESTPDCGKPRRPRPQDG